MDEDEIAFREKQKAGALFGYSRPHASLTLTSRCKGKQRDGREGQRQRAAERRAAGYQEIWKEVGIVSDC